MTMTNAEWLVKNKYDFGSIYLVDKHDDGLFKIMYKNCRNCIGEVVSVTSAGALIKWLSSEHKEPILDDAEKRYLSAVIKPFRKHVKYIRKSGYGTSIAEFIIVDYKQTIENTDYFYLPAFKAGTMYKGMEFGRKYTLEELGL